MGKDEKSQRKNIRGPIAHIARVPLTEDEHVELETVCARDRATYAETMRRAFREYAEKRRA